ncbi:MAG: hypothetical protein ABT940_10100 [Alphaproteobacteria bacterium]
MSLFRVMMSVVAGGGLLVAALTPAPAWAAGKKAGPACSAVSFRPVPSGMSDGEHDAGLYKFKFGKAEVKAVVKGGEAQDYYLTINGKRPAALTGALPKGAEACLRSKHVKTPVKTQQSGACTGTRFRVVVDTTGKDRLVTFFGLKGDEWHMCSASKG